MGSDIELWVGYKRLGIEREKYRLLDTTFGDWIMKASTTVISYSLQEEVSQPSTKDGESGSPHLSRVTLERGRRR